MAHWVDIFSLFMTIGILGGIVWVIVTVLKQATESFQTTKQKMKDKGYEVSGKGVSIKTSKRFDRQDYIDATQRSMMKTMNATSFNRRPDANPSSSSTQATFANASAGPVMADRLSAKTSGNSGDKKSVFGGLRKNTM